jgi:hypothetical protein
MWEYTAIEELGGLNEFIALCKRFGLHQKARIQDLPTNLLAERLSVETLSKICGSHYFGNQFSALKIKDKKKFKQIDHQQWDLNLSGLSGERVCGQMTDDGKCPNPFENDLDFWLEVRPQLKLKTV